MILSMYRIYWIKKITKNWCRAGLLHIEGSFNLFTIYDTKLSNRDDKVTKMYCIKTSDNGKYVYGQTIYTYMERTLHLDENNR